jgi:fused signal recognition particle receptor
MILKTAFCVISITIGFCASVAHSKSLAGSYLAGSNAAMRGDYVAASKYFAETLLLDPQNQYIKYNAMLSNLSMGDVRTATNYAKEITSNSNNNQHADLLIFADHIKNERYGLAHKILKRNEENYTELLFGLLNGILRDEIAGLLSETNLGNDTDFNIPENKKCYVLMVVGVNGVGKTTTIGKLASQFKKKGLKVVLGASDTFRAAAIDQLQVWADRVQVPLIRQEMGSDPASVAFDTLTSAVSQNADVVIIDTAGRLHNKVNLMNELTKIKRVMQKVVEDSPHDVLLVLDGSTGQNAIEQAKQFTAATDVSSIALTKLDGTAKGGVVIGISDQFKIPVRYIGVGEGINDLQEFSKQDFIDSIFS